MNIHAQAILNNISRVKQFFASHNVLNFILLAHKIFTQMSYSVLTLSKFKIWQYKLLYMYFHKLTYKYRKKYSLLNIIVTLRRLWLVATDSPATVV